MELEINNIFEVDEAALVEKAQFDADAFSELYQRYVPRVYRYVYNRLINTHDAEDITAQVFTEALEGLTANRFRKGNCFAVWLFTIARRRLIDFYRKKPESVLHDPPVAEPGLGTMVEASEDLNHLKRLLSEVSEERRELLRLRFSADLNYAEIGMIVGKSEAAVKMAVYRTLEFLRIHWENENG